MFKIRLKTFYGRLPRKHVPHQFETCVYYFTMTALSIFNESIMTSCNFRVHTVSCNIALMIIFLLFTCNNEV